MKPGTRRRMTLLSVSLLATLVASPASALTVGTVTTDFESYGNYYSAVSPDGSLIAYSANDSDVVTILNTATGGVQAVTDVDGEISMPAGITFSPDGDTIYVANAGHSDIVIIDAVLNEVSRTISDAAISDPIDVVISPDGQTLYSSDFYGSNIDVVNVGTGSVEASIPTSFSIRRLYISPDGTHAFAVGDSGAVEKIDLMNFTVTDSFNGATISGDLGASCTNTDVTILYVTDYTDDDIHAMSLLDGSVVASNTEAVLPDRHNQTCEVSPDGKSLFTIDESFGHTGSEYTDILIPANVAEYDAGTLEYKSTLDLSNVAYALQINFYNECYGYVVGWYGNAERIDYCEILAETGFEGSTMLEVTGIAFLLAGTVLVLLRRRHTFRVI